jgi:hypothetical protein
MGFDHPTKTEPFVIPKDKDADAYAYVPEDVTMFEAFADFV